MKDTLRVFEAFSGIGAQKMAIRNIGVRHEVVGTAEVDVDAILSYASMHCEEAKINIGAISYEEMKEYLKAKNIGLDFQTHKSKIDSMKDEKLQKLYKATITSKNLGDIGLIDCKEVPDHDLFTYSFPCQDISTFGTQMSCEENSGTRSSLLWECKKLIEEKKPKYLLLENVKNLIGNKHKRSFDLWLNWLNAQGYDSFTHVLDSKDYGIPQRRPRVFVISILREMGYETIFEKPETLAPKSLTYFLEANIEFEISYNIDELNSYFPNIKIKDFVIEDGEIKFWDDRDWKYNGIMIGDLCSTQRAGRSGLKCVKREGNLLKVRRLTTKECWRLMGFSDDDYTKVVSAGITKTQILKQCGNSIVVDVLEKIFSNLFEDYIVSQEVNTHDQCRIAIC
ncbi:MAG: DNA (cytosine-5-)-methyltransferase [Clostridiaceae bacterium]|nr:DNA (cytosine-5-)-methyltransferase [Clostridiaceae bacterium]